MGLWNNSPGFRNHSVRRANLFVDCWVCDVRSQLERSPVLTSWKPPYHLLCSGVVRTLFDNTPFSPTWNLVLVLGWCWGSFNLRTSREPVCFSTTRAEPRHCTMSVYISTFPETLAPSSSQPQCRSTCVNNWLCKVSSVLFLHIRIFFVCLLFFFFF